MPPIRRQDTPADRIAPAAQWPQLPPQAVGRGPVPTPLAEVDVVVPAPRESCAAPVGALPPAPPAPPRQPDWQPAPGNSLLNCCMQTGDLPGAWAAYLDAWASGGRGLLAASMVERLLLLLLARGPFWPQIHNLLRLEHDLGTRLSASALRAVEGRAASTGDIGLAGRPPEGRSRRPASLMDYDHALAHAARYHPGQVVAVLTDMQAAGLEPGARALEIWAAGRVGAGDLQEAERIIGHMQNWGLRPPAQLLAYFRGRPGTSVRF